MITIDNTWFQQRGEGWGHPIVPFAAMLGKDLSCLKAQSLASNDPLLKKDWLCH